MFKKLLCLLWLTITPLSSHADLASPIDVKDPTQPPTTSARALSGRAVNHWHTRDEYRRVDHAHQFHCDV